MNDHTHTWTYDAELQELVCEECGTSSFSGGGR